MGTIHTNFNSEQIDRERYQEFIKIADKNNTELHKIRSIVKKGNYTPHYVILEQQLVILSQLFDMYYFRINKTNRDKLEKEIKVLRQTHRQVKSNPMDGRVFDIPNSLNQLTTSFFKNLHWQIQKVQNNIKDDKE